MNIKVIELRLLESGKPLKAFADVEFDEWLIIREFRVIQKDGKRPKVHPPQASWKGPLGNIMYRPLVTMPDDIAGRVSLEILKHFVEAMEGKSSEQSRIH